MQFADTLKDLRKSKNMSQEQLAEKLYVSRQAITKWETGNGLPDIENIIAIGALFNVSLDSLLNEEKSILTKHQFLYESVTQYDLDEEKKIDIRFGTCHEVIVERTASEKIEILAASNKLHDLAKQVKVKIEETSKLMDVTVKHTADLTDVAAKADLFILIKIPQQFVPHLELNGITEILRIRDITMDHLEFGGKFRTGFLTNCSGHIELDTSEDLTVEADGFKGKVDFNQIKATSVLKIKSGTCHLRRLGSYERFIDENDQVIELAKSRRKDEGLQNDSEADFIVEIAGWKSELKICK